ncbi:PepSY-associated TM helix domain-containing protein [Thauera sp. SDU_THAU2]|uniref:PepSY-associated TM helix domain-containing protein n=1 Tax=Thauera sp. SDU_THAU2 TaxID=3136633 RepID=UPI00311DF894
MKDGFRRSMAWLHTWTGLVAGWLLFYVFVTGTASYFIDEITRWMQPERPLVQAPVYDDSVPAVAAMLERAFDRLEQVAPGGERWFVSLPHDDLAPRGRQGLSIAWETMPQAGEEHGDTGRERLDAATGAVLPKVETRQTAGGHGLSALHYDLHHRLPHDWGLLVTGAAAMLMLLAIVSGVITHKKIFTDFFTFRPGKGQRGWLDAHNAVSVMALPFFLMITYSGLVFSLYTYMPAARTALYDSSHAYVAELFLQDTGEAVAVSRPATALAPLLAQAEAEWGRAPVAYVYVTRFAGGPLEIKLVQKRSRHLVRFWVPPSLRFDAQSGERLAGEADSSSALDTERVLLNLHFGLFAGWWGRWLFFVSGLLGCAMIATGLVLWTIKRRKRHLGSGQEHAESFGLRLVEVLNVTTIAGLPIAVAAYFWANRLLPVGMADRGDWELHTLFAVWLATLCYALARPLPRAWIELSWGACAAFALVPVLNALTTDKHLGSSLPHALGGGDWALAGFDLTMWGLAAVFALIARKIQRKLAPAPSTMALKEQSA